MSIFEEGIHLNQIRSTLGAGAEEEDPERLEAEQLWAEKWEALSAEVASEQEVEGAEPIPRERTTWTLVHFPSYFFRNKSSLFV